MIVRDQIVTSKTLKKGELYKRCTLIDCTNEGAILDECVETSGQPYQAPIQNESSAVVDEPTNPYQ